VATANDHKETEALEDQILCDERNATAHNPAANLSLQGEETEMKKRPREATMLITEHLFVSDFNTQTGFCNHPADMDAGSFWDHPQFLVWSVAGSKIKFEIGSTVEGTRIGFYIVEAGQQFPLSGVPEPK
ncbi:hypothetical protein KIPB_012213, partial [Kipferlia bialata]